MVYPKVGVCIPAHNAKKYIEMCLTSLKAQTYPVSIYIVDDASDDGLYGFLSDRPEWYTEIYANSHREGWPISLNRAVIAALDDGCDAVFLMNADDFLRLDCIEKAVEAIQHHDWVVCNAQQVGGENVVQACKLNATLEDFKGYPPITNYMLIPSGIWQEVGGYPTDVTMPGNWGYKEDWAFDIELFQHGYTNYAVVEEPVYYYVMHEDQLHEPGELRHAEAKKLIMDKYGL